MVGSGKARVTGVRMFLTPAAFPNRLGDILQGLELWYNGDMNTRICCECGQEKLLEDFPRNRTKKLGHGYCCKKCWRMYDKDKSKKPQEIARVRRWHQSERGKMMDKRRRLLRKDKIRVKNMLNYLIERGIIQRRPCEVCGDKNGQGHHPDYSKPLEVIWLCQNHHSAEHKRLNNLTQSL